MWVPLYILCMMKNISTESKLVLIGLLISGSVFIATVFFGSGGFFRHVTIFFPEVIQATVAFKNVDGHLKIIGIKGNVEINPTLIGETGETYILTVLNHDNIVHRFYLDGLNLSTKILYPSQSDIITIHESKEGNYKYYDIVSDKFKTNALGVFKVVTVEKYWRKARKITNDGIMI